MSTTIGISLYKKPYHYVKQCVESALNQTAEVKVVLRTEGPESCDEKTLNYLRELSQKEDKFSLIEGSEKIGIYPSYNVIFDSVDTDNLCQLDSDDYLQPNAIQICEKVLNQHPYYSMVYTDCMNVDEKGNELGLNTRQNNELSSANLLISFMTYHLRLIRTRVFNAVGRFDESLPFSGDYDICLKISEIGVPNNIGYIPMPLYNYRVYPGTMSDVNFHQTNIESQIASQNALERRGLSSRYKTLLNYNTGELLVHPIPSDNREFDFSNSQPIVFTGMHRSCTSLISSMLRTLGIDMGESVLEPDDFNPDGYFENKEFLFFDTHLCAYASESGQGFYNWGWVRGKGLREEVLKDFTDPAKYLIGRNIDKKLWGWKDPRTSLLLDFWNPLIPNAKYIFVYRNPSDVIRSVSKLNIPVFNKNPGYIEECWRDHNKNILKFYQENESRCLLISTDQILKNANVLKMIIENKFKLELKNEDLNSLVNKNYLHSTDEVVASDETMSLFNDLNTIADLPLI